MNDGRPSGVVGNGAAKAVVVEEEPIELVDDAVAGIETKQPSKIHGFSVLGTAQAQQKFKRKPHFSGTGAIRVKSFHGRLSDQGLEYLDKCINEFLDSNPEIEVKFVTSVTGMYDGKIKEPAVILNVWY